MKAMILAAGRGERLRPWTDRQPKPLVEIAGQPLIAHHLRALAAAGFCEVVINVAYRGDQIVAALGTGQRYGVTITYSHETPGALDTGGGVARALPLLGEGPFALISSDVVTDFDYRCLPRQLGADLGHFVLVANPAHHRDGDFGLRDGRIVETGPRSTYAGIAVFSAEAFATQADSRFPLSAVMHAARAAGRASGQHHAGRWLDVGRPASLARARQAGAPRGDVCESGGSRC
ncbi:N-acetylmuramate alpha-1-phosphate uridylyltransferase MurU [Salinisphaera sp. Q1T1-3]|uniref:N-acetylmuramate alpha-1-phosphate uridylyltransferase MurU n=1 Tax=Salinisphaera sp. Q1T1-3 TaxID=2321229 RepID=UPI000E75DA4C|nr:nucleotidyltransferase family protein [Salinisphaera sp. Q1T1-3]RJS93997.1 nucleotidyltransferase family protein [Salinisphaera sp. Q1T1-3]